MSSYYRFFDAMKEGIKLAFEAKKGYIYFRFQKKLSPRGSV
ncbi:hypothetical protein M23134_02347 [Microscilla marina ATCC 23134]|uniref:Uncharacterized protein n=1 Tax=Microscilla marina ATCC 23134 TaxID=313606 RepID=A1ZKD0_MICM2|nr:hypothetical protein M23134_02347 [Microscilla marina ATCC 23134]